MNLALLDQKVLQLINQYSINGSLVSDTSNADYLLKTRNLIDACQKEIADEFPIVKEETWVQTPVDNPTDFVTHALPANCEKIINIYIKKYPVYQLLTYTVQGENLIFNPALDGTIILNYNKTPDDITVTSLSTLELEIGIKFQELIPYYVAGWIYLEDNPTISTMLLNAYETKKNKLNYVVPSSSIEIENVFEGFI